MKRLGPGVAALRTVVFAFAAAACVAAIPACAADLPAPAPAYYPPVYAPALYNWTGLYFGGQVGAGLLADTVTQAAPGAVTLTDSVNASKAGVIGGGQVGVNYQFSSWVIGAEGSWSATNISGSSKATTTVGGQTERATSAPLWFAAATGRVGYAANDWLFYAKGGGAWMDVNYTEDILLGNVTSASQKLSDTRNGFTVGIGVEYGLTENVSARLEYDFYDFGTTTYNFNPATFTPVGIRSELNVLAFGLNYRFNGH
jgi:outer membrane immunogenic protein